MEHSKDVTPNQDALGEELLTMIKADVPAKQQSAVGASIACTLLVYEAEPWSARPPIGADSKDHPAR